jgi:chemotaxis protein CheZ
MREPGIKRRGLKTIEKLGSGMAAPRKIFRIEENTRSAPRSAAPPSHDEGDEAQRHHELMTELLAVRALLDQHAQLSQAPTETNRAQIADAHELKRELDLIHEAIRRTKQDVGGLEANAFIGPQMARVGRELDAVIAGTEHATQNILKNAEDIDQIATTLSSMLKGSYETGLVHDLRDHVVKIFEACNFQDLTGQRIGKVIATLKFIEDHINRMLEIWRRVESAAPFAQAASGKVHPDAKFLNGPKLADDPGHSSQADIDVIFDAN